ncbi:MAG: transposase, partial [Thiohalocapsa sp.]
AALDEAPLCDLRIALNQDQPIGNDRFYAEIHAMTGQRREPRKRGRPRKRDETEPRLITPRKKFPL